MWKFARCAFVIPCVAAYFIHCSPAYDDDTASDNLLTAAGGKMQADTDGRYPAIGQLLLKQQDGRWLLLCSATLIDKTRIVAAGHCYTGPGDYMFRTVSGKDDGTDGMVEQNWPIMTIGVHPDYYRIQNLDLAVAILAGAGVTDPKIQPMKFSSLAPKLDDALMVVGFGITKWGEKDDGVRRIGSATIDAYNGTYYLYGQSPGEAFLCRGDSGGPSLDASGAIVGIHSQSNCWDNQEDARTDPNIVSTNVDIRVDDLGLQHALRYGDPIRTIPSNARYRIWLTELVFDTPIPLADDASAYALDCGSWGRIDALPFSSATASVTKVKLPFSNDGDFYVSAQSLRAGTTCRLHHTRTATSNDTPLSDLTISPATLSDYNLRSMVVKVAAGNNSITIAVLPISMLPVSARK